MNDESAKRRTVTVSVDTESSTSGVIEVHLVGDGPAVVLIPSAGRGSTDFDDLADRLADAGYTAVMAEPRGIGATRASLGALTMDLLAADITAVIRTVAPSGRAFAIVGHAFGQRIARLTATNDPDVVDNVILLAAGGMIEPEPTDAAALLLAFDDSLDDDTRLDAIRRAFFAPGNDPSSWRAGWHPLVAYLQGEAKNTVPTSTWWTAGRCPVLVVQPAQDVIAVPANADSLLAAIGERAELVTIENAGHALLPEQPELVATCIIGWLDERRDEATTD